MLLRVYINIEHIAAFLQTRQPIGSVSEQGAAVLAGYVGVDVANEERVVDPATPVFDRQESDRNFVDCLSNKTTAPPGKTIDQCATRNIFYLVFCKKE